MVPSSFRRVDPSPQPYYLRLHLAPTDGIPAGYGTVRSVRLRVQLSLSFARLASADLSQTHLSTSAPLSRPKHHGFVSGQLYETPSGGTGHGISLSCRLSTTGVRFLDILFPPGTFSSPYGRPTDHDGRTLSGFPCSARVRHGRGGCSLHSGAVVSSRLHGLPATGAYRFPTASPQPR
jgi:hypothetical protein